MCEMWEIKWNSSHSVKKVLRKYEALLRFHALCKYDTRAVVLLRSSYICYLMPIMPKWHHPRNHQLSRLVQCWITQVSINVARKKWKSTPQKMLLFNLISSNIIKIANGKNISYKFNWAHVRFYDLERAITRTWFWKILHLSDLLYTYL